MSQQGQSFSTPNKESCRGDMSKGDVEVDPQPSSLSLRINSPSTAVPSPIDYPPSQDVPSEP